MLLATVASSQICNSPSRCRDRPHIKMVVLPSNSTKPTIKIFMYMNKFNANLLRGFTQFRRGRLYKYFLLLAFEDLSYQWFISMRLTPATDDIVVRNNDHCASWGNVVSNSHRKVWMTEVPYWLLNHTFVATVVAERSHVGLSSNF